MSETNHKFRTLTKRELHESVSCWAYDDGSIYISHDISDWCGIEAGAKMRLTVEMATFLRDRLTDILGHDAAYEAWIASRDKAYGVGPLDTEDPASRFAADEPLPATDAEYAERQIERGAP